MPESDGARVLGLTDYDNATIYISPLVRDDSLTQTYIHEILHAALNAMGWEKANRDEDRIDALAGLLTQALTTAK